MSSAPIRRLLQEVQIRPIAEPGDFRKAEQVQIETWGFGDLDVVPAALFSVAHNFGGQALGAFQRQRMVGFALSFGAVEEGHAHFHSHMVAVVPEYQNSGLGRQIKLAQREDALSRGVDRIVWTFDPLQLRNAHFNLARLGGIGVRYLPDLYGKTSSPLHGGMPTDRLVVEWNLQSPPVLKALAGWPSTRTAHAKIIPIRADLTDCPVAERMAAQQALRRRMMELLADGYAVKGFERTGAMANYILEKHL